MYGVIKIIIDNSCTCIILLCIHIYIYYVLINFIVPNDSLFWTILPWTYFRIIIKPTKDNLE